MLRLRGGWGRAAALAALAANLAALATLASLAALAAAGYRAVCGSGCGLLPGRQRQQSVELCWELPRHSARVRAGLRGDHRLRVLRPHLARRKPR